MPYFISKLLDRPLLAGTVLFGTTALGSAAGVSAALAIHDETPAIVGGGNAPVGNVHKAALTSQPSSSKLADMVEAVVPAVVQVQASGMAEAQITGFPVPDDGAFGQMFRHFFEGAAPGGQQIEQALGSGFIIDPSGIIVTNNHVIDHADKVTIKLSDGRELPATVVGRDEKTDLAVLRIKGGGNFPAIAWGDSDHVRVGDDVFAVGSPFGLGNTVTTGIVSGRGREIGQGPYDDFLQIDAAINQGNSGGPLFDTSGRVVGVNTAIYSPSGGSVGIGFAIPSRMAQSIVRQIAAHGSVARGQIGVSIQAVTPDIADSLGLGEARGALVAAVTPGSPAAQAGFRTGDIVTSFDHRPITDARDLSRAVADARVGATTPAEIVRNGRKIELAVKVGALDEKQFAARAGRLNPGAVPGGDTTQMLGLTVTRTTPELNAEAGHPDAARGVLVTDIDQASESAERGLRPGDLIVAVNNLPVDTPAAFSDKVRSAEKGGRHNVLLDVMRGDEHAFIAVPLA